MAFSIPINELKTFAFLYYNRGDLINPYQCITPPTGVIGKGWSGFEGSSAEHMFGDIKNKLLTRVDTHDIEKLNSLFTYSDIVISPRISLHSARDISYLYNGCSSLIYVPELDFSNIPDKSPGVTIPINGVFENCTSLKKIGKLVFNSTNTSCMNNVFYNCPSLKYVWVEGTIKINSKFLLFDSKTQSLTSDSLMSFINAFEDNTEEETQYTVTIGSINLAKLSAEQIAVATNKNILLA